MRYLYTLAALVLCAAAATAGRPRQAPRPPQAPPVRLAVSCGDPSCTCGCNVGGACDCVKSPATWTPTSAPTVTTVAPAAVAHPRPAYYVQPPVYHYQPVYQPSYRPVYFGGFGGSCSGGGCGG